MLVKVSSPRTRFLKSGSRVFRSAEAPHSRTSKISAPFGRSARANAARNGIENAEFIAGDVSRELKRLLGLAERPTVAFVDPPRSGLAPKAVRRLIELAPRRIVYVSCNPTTLAPNGRQLADAGYTLERVRPVDMFPHTHHIEAVASFRRG